MPTLTWNVVLLAVNNVKSINPFNRGERAMTTDTASKRKRRRKRAESRDTEYEEHPYETEHYEHSYAC